ncbi:hypothetical protein BASA81_006921 [Batrachochytrium salamandrivorans]|nr:hypothetical protein BASA81_006921 [Batrachochytrium salamandrivorans]
MAGLLLVFLLYWIASLPGLHALTNQCSTTSCSSASKGTKSCSATVTKDFWAGNPVNNAPTTSPTGLIQMVPDVCEPGFEPFDGRCYSYSMGTFGAPVNVGGLNKPQALTWEAAEAMCQTFSADAYFGGCHLASINTPRENCFVYEKITGSPSFAVPTSSPTKGLIKDNRAFNDYNGCHSNNYGLGDSAQTNGVCWLGLDQKSGTEGLAYAWNDASRYDRRPYRSGGFSPWAGDETTAIINCFNSATGEMCKASSSSFYYEPNNIAGGKEDCTQIWDRTSSVGEWNDEPCANVYPYVCNKLARCLPGFYRSVVYKGMPVRRNPALVDWGIDTSYSKGLCTQCAAGTFHLQNAISNYEAICSFCPAGYHGVAGETKALCTAICPVGKYCPMGTPSSNVPLCQAGTYNPSQGKSSQDDCLVAQAGYYSVAGASAQTKCPTGRCGFPAAQTATCQNACPSGYYCLAGTGCLDQSVTVERLPQPCGSISKYSASGQSACTNALAGEYTYGQTETTRMGVLACPPGYWCSGGVQTPCPLGTYNALGSQSVPGSCQACTAGYFCPLASTSPIQQVCAPFAGNATMYYCPAGTTARLVVSNNYYSTDAAGSALTRSGQAPCTTAQICINGVAYDKLVWDSTSCSAISIAENQATPQVKTIAAVLNTNLTGYTVNYTMSNFGLAADLVASLGSGPCNPNLAGNNAPYSNKGIFALSPAGRSR